MAHPSNEPGKTYDVDDRRRDAALAACDGIPTEWLERGIIKKLYEFIAVLALLDTMSKPLHGYIQTPHRWWQEHIRGGIDQLNEIAQPGFLPKTH